MDQKTYSIFLWFLILSQRRAPISIRDVNFLNKLLICAGLELVVPKKQHAFLLVSNGVVFLLGVICTSILWVSKALRGGGGRGEGAETYWVLFTVIVYSGWYLRGDGPLMAALWGPLPRRRPFSDRGWTHRAGQCGSLKMKKGGWACSQVPL